MSDQFVQARHYDESSVDNNAIAPGSLAAESQIGSQDWQDYLSGASTQDSSDPTDGPMVGGDGPPQIERFTRLGAYVADVVQAASTAAPYNQFLQIVPRIYDYVASGGDNRAGGGTMAERLTTLLTGLGVPAARQTAIQTQLTALMRLVEGGQVPRINFVNLCQSLAGIQERVTAGVPAADRAALASQVEARIRAAQFPMLRIRDGVSAATSLAMSEGLSTIPRNMLDAVARAGYNVIGVRSYSEIVAGAGDRVASPGRTWDQAYSGIFWSAENAVVVREGGGHAWMVGTTRHEVGHAIDYIVGGGGSYHSQSAAFREVWQAERDEINALIRQHAADTAAGRTPPRGINATDAAHLSYYIGANSQTEAWAEIFCVMYGGTPDHRLNDLIRTHFPRSTRLVREALDAHFRRPR